ncbi:MAG TPA: hypothetical protein VK281_10095 [Xanthobacteraceae bacterium]|nr:hypothetical protein [Xanthobacteraceae bacterium]
MLMALVLVCSLQVTPDLADCSRTNAVSVVRVPEEFSNPTTCLMHGQAYLADTSIGRDLDDSQRVKVVCARTQRLGDLQAAGANSR